MPPRKGGRTGIRSTLKNCSVAIAGPLGDQWNSENVERWCSYNSATFSNVVDETVTHLLATSEQYKEKIPPIKKALRYKKIHIVTRDWFEDSLNKRRRLNEKVYSLREEERKAKAKKKREEKAQKGIEEAVDFVNTNLNRIYRDEANFPYEITLTRDEKEHLERYVLYLWESNAKPPLYHFAAKFYKKPRDNRPAIYRPSETPNLLEHELERFKEFFRQKTGLHWDDRVARAGTVIEGKFQYQPPTGGKPVGVINDPISRDQSYPENP